MTDPATISVLLTIKLQPYLKTKYLEFWNPLHRPVPKRLKVLEQFSAIGCQRVAIRGLCNEADTAKFFEPGVQHAW